MTDDSPPPHDPQAERALLGAMLLFPQAIADAQLVAADDFYLPAHAAIADAILTRHTASKPIDALLIATDLHQTTAARNLPGGAGPYLHTCIEACPSPSHAGHYARIVAEKAAARRLLTLAEDLTKAAYLDDTDSRAALLSTTQHQLGRVAAATRARSPIRLTPASAFQIKPVLWLWEDRMPVGEITLIPGREGVGKSTFLAWLAAAITNGNLPGIHHGQPRAVLYAASEDAWSYTIAPRMKAAGANLDLVYRIDVEDDDGSGSGLVLPRHCHYLPDKAAEVDAAVLMCDPLMSLLDDNISSFKAQELRRALEPLRKAAEEARIAVPALVHFNKSGNTDINSAIAGARAFVEVARAVVAIAQDKEADEYTCVVSQTKNNLGRLDLPNLMYTMDSITLETDDPSHHATVGRLRWLGETDVTAEDLLSGASEDRPKSENTLMVLEWINSLGRPVLASEVVDHFKADITHENIKKILARSVKRGDLVSPSRGVYEAVSPGGNRRKGTHKASSARAHAYANPPVTSVPSVPNPGQGGFMGGRDVSPEVSPGTRSPVGDTGDTSDTGIRARDDPGQVSPEARSCFVCYRPTDSPSGICDRHDADDEPIERERYP